MEMETIRLMPGKLSRVWRAMVEQNVQEGVDLLDTHRVAYFVWLVKQYGQEAVTRHAHRIDRAMTNIAKEVQQEMGISRKREGGGLEL